MPTGTGAFGFFPGMIAQISAENDDLLSGDLDSLHAQIDSKAITK